MDAVVLFLPITRLNIHYIIVYYLNIDLFLTENNIKLQIN